MRRTGKTLAVAVAAVAFAAAGCTSSTQTGAGPSPSASGASGAAKGTLTLGATLDLQGWDPAKQPGYQSWAHEAVWDTLVKCDANGKATPDVADTFEVTDNNTTFKAHIREGQKFSDGTAVDSAAVKASFEFVKDAGINDDYKGLKIKLRTRRTSCSPGPSRRVRSWTTRSATQRSLPGAWLKAGKFDAPSAGRTSTTPPAPRPARCTHSPRTRTIGTRRTIRTPSSW